MYVYVYKKKEKEKRNWEQESVQWRRMEQLIKSGGGVGKWRNNEN